MVFYTIKFMMQPQIQFACSTTFSVEGQKNNIIDHRNNMIEIGYLNGGTAEYYLDDMTEPTQMLEQELMIFMPDSRYELHISAQSDTTQVTMTSAAVEIDDLQYQRHETETAAEAAEIITTLEAGTILLPQLLHPSDGDFQLLSALFRTMISSWALGTAAGSLMSLSNWYEIIASLDTAFRGEIKRLVLDEERHRERSAVYYVRKAKKYIESNFQNRISLSDIAAELEISQGYLCSMFKNSTGCTVVEYINMVRVQHLREKIAQGDGRRFSHICAEVGLHDIRYAQRLFKKYFGVSMRHCRQIENGISLYHKNPWVQPVIDHDIYNDPAPTEAENEMEDFEESPVDADTAEP